MSVPTMAVCAGLLAMGALGHFLPLFTRPDLFFGVTVDPAFRLTQAARRIVRDYRVALWCGAIAAAAIVWLLHRPAAGLLAYVIGAGGAQVAAHRRALPHATARSAAVEVDLSAPEEHLPGGALAALIPFVVLVGLAAWALPHIDGLPDRLAIHWGLDGPNRWMITSVRALIVLLLQHALLCLLLVASAWGVLHWSRRISVSGPAAAAERAFRRRVVLLLLTVEYFTVLPPVLILLQAPAFAMKSWSLALLGTVLAFVVSLMRIGQGGARLAKVEGSPTGDRTADARWVGGLIYFNRTDPAVLVEKRMGIGWTLNLGNPWSWVALIGVAVLIVIGPMLARGLDSTAVMPPMQPADRGGKSGPASAGTEGSLRRYIDSLEAGHPNYEEMSPKLAASVKRQLPKITTVIAALGGLQSLRYTGADSNGWDVYVAAFAHGQLEWHIGPLVDGKAAYRYARPLR